MTTRNRRLTAITTYDTDPNVVAAKFGLRLRRLQPSAPGTEPSGPVGEPLTYELIKEIQNIMGDPNAGTDGPW